MKRSFLILITCLCALAIASFGLTACGGNSSSSSGTSQGGSSAASDSGDSEDGGDPSLAEMGEDSIRSTFEQMLTGMSEYYEGTTAVGEHLYYAGGADGDNAIFIILVPESSTSLILIGPVEVGDDNTLTVTDSTTNSSVSFKVYDNDDGTYSFTMGDQYGVAIMSRCSSAAIVDALTTAVMEAANETAAAAGTEGSEGAEGTENQ